jgi:hypothetical protein
MPCGAAPRLKIAWKPTPIAAAVFKCVVNFAELARQQATRYSVNAEFNKAVLYFNDTSSIEFDDTSRQNHRATASSDGTTAYRICKSIGQFRLNAKHLQLFFEDGSSAEFK